jgi:hypothetical protein
MVRNGTAGAAIGKILEDVKPEVIYFSEQDGKRGAIMVVDIASPSGVPAVAEPFFLTLNASVKFRVAMTPEDLMASGLEEIAKKYQ